MGKVNRVFADELISSIPDRNANRIFIFETPKGEIGLHYRNLKLIFSQKESIDELKEAFRGAKEEFMKRKHLINYEI